VDPVAVEATRCRGIRGGGVGMWREPGGGQGGGRRFAGVVLAVVKEVVGKDPTTVVAWRWSRSGRARGWWLNEEE
jgi:hypothetical protein